MCVYTIKGGGGQIGSHVLVASPGGAFGNGLKKLMEIEIVLMEKEIDSISIFLGYILCVFWSNMYCCSLIEKRVRCV